MRTPLTWIVAAGICLLCHSVTAYSQDQIDSLENAINVPHRYINKVEGKFLHLEKQLTQHTKKYLQRLAKKDNKLLQKISTLDSSISHQLSGGPQYYSNIVDQINEKVDVENLEINGEYLAYIDSIRTSLAFLKESNKVLSGSKEWKKTIGGSLLAVKQFQGKLQQSEQIKELIKQRRVQIAEYLGRYSKLPDNVRKAYFGYTKELYYYSAKIKEYKDIANDPDKLTRKALALLNNSKAFQEFARNYGQLAGLFSLPANYGNAQNLGGLQTKSQVAQAIQSNLSVGGDNAIQVLQQNVQAAQAQIDQLKDKVNTLGNGGADMSMPDFKPNSQKTKTFWRRLEYGTNFQTTKNNFFPTTTDLGLSVGYKISDKSTIGIGASYKLGLGKDIKHIAITHQGLGLRSYLDIKIKGSFFASGGFEYNYTIPFTEIQQLYDIDTWKKSGLVGVSKIVSLKSKWAKKTKIQVLWDMLYAQQVPRTQPVLFRIGYTF